MFERCAELERDNHRLRERARWLERSRDGWKEKALAAQWGIRQFERRLSTRSTDLFPTESAERSGVA